MTLVGSGGMDKIFPTPFTPCTHNHIEPKRRRAAARSIFYIYSEKTWVWLRGIIDSPTTRQNDNGQNLFPVYPDGMIFPSSSFPLTDVRFYPSTVYSKSILTHTFISFLPSSLIPFPPFFFPILQSLFSLEKQKLD
jgi:hypothetical protein